MTNTSEQWKNAKFVCRVLEAGNNATPEDRAEAFWMVRQFRDQVHANGVEQDKAQEGEPWMMELAKEIKANAEDHPKDYISKFALQWADVLAARAVAAPAAVPVSELNELAARWSYLMPSIYWKTKNECADELRALIDKAKE